MAKHRAFGLVVVGLFACVLCLPSCGTTAVARPPVIVQVPPPPGNSQTLNFGQTADFRFLRGQWVADGFQTFQIRDDPKEQNAVMYYDPRPLADADIKVTVRMISQEPRFQIADDEATRKVKRGIAGAGLVFRFQDENNFYMFRLAGEEGAVLGKIQDGQWVELLNPRAAQFMTPGPSFAGALLQFDKDYVIRVRFAGQRIQCWIDDRAVASVDDASFSLGRIGLVTFRTQASFRSFSYAPL